MNSILDCLYGFFVIQRMLNKKNEWVAMNWVWYYLIWSFILLCLLDGPWWKGVCVCWRLHVQMGDWGQPQLSWDCSKLLCIIRFEEGCDFLLVLTWWFILSLSSLIISLWILSTRFYFIIIIFLTHSYIFCLSALENCFFFLFSSIGFIVVSLHNLNTKQH
jgi:hypothetical protein